MNILCAAALAALLASNLAAFADTEGTCGQILTAPLRSRAVLTIDSKSAGIEIVGTDQETIHVSCTVRDGENAADYHIKLSGNQDERNVSITGGSQKNSNLQVRFEVPRKTSLKVRMAAGEVTVKEIAGDKDLDLKAGQISIDSARPWNYRSVDLSVDIGEVKVGAYGADKGGFFPSFKKKTADGEYGLRAHVITGEIDLQGTHTPPAPE